MDRTPLPEVDLRQVLTLTDDTGLLQHAKFATPDRPHGYCTDDNARALIAAVRYARLYGYDERAMPLQRYLSFLADALGAETDRFRNFMGYDRHWLEDTGSHDSHGRAVWALGVTTAGAPNASVRARARTLFTRALRAAERFDSIRARAFVLLGLDAYLKVEPDARDAADLRLRLAETHFQLHRRKAAADWPWWEDTLTYDNAKLPHALLVSGASLERPDMLRAALAALEWLLKIQTAQEGHLSVIGNRGWLTRGRERARFDQQPLEAYALVHACLDAARITAEADWADHARRCFAWFRGGNDLGISLFNEETGGCYDGLEPEGVNLNQGAESTLAYLLSLLELHAYEREEAG